MNEAQRQAMVNLRTTLTTGSRMLKADDKQWALFHALGELTVILDAPVTTDELHTPPPSFCPICHAVEDLDYIVEVYPGVLVLKCPNGHRREVGMTREECDALTAWQQAQYAQMGIEGINE